MRAREGVVGPGEGAVERADGGWRPRAVVEVEAAGVGMPDRSSGRRDEAFGMLVAPFSSMMPVSRLGLRLFRYEPPSSWRRSSLWQAEAHKTRGGIPSLVKMG